MSLRINLFGTPSIMINGKTCCLTLKKAEAIVYCLSISGTMRRSKLASFMWGGKDEESANNNLRNALSYLRSCLPKGSIESDRQSVTLKSFESDITRIKDIANIDIPLPAFINDAFLDNFDIADSAEFSEWKTAVSQSIKNSIISLLKDRITLCYDYGNDFSAICALESLVNIDPFDEDSILELAELYFKTAANSKAIQMFKTYRNLLESEMKTVPSQRAEEVFTQLLTGAKSSSHAKEEGLESYFYGRTEEQKNIIKKIEHSPWKNVVFLIEGEPGIGKTSLVKRIISLMEPGGYFTLSTLAYEAGHDYPYSAWDNMAARLGMLAESGNIKDIEPHLLILAGVFSNFMNDKRLSYNADFIKMSARTPNAIALSMCHIIAQAAAGRTTVLSADDLQWFDDMSLRLLESYLTIKTPPSIVFITTRPEKSDYALGMLRRIEKSGALDLTHIRLKPFNEKETQSFCQKFLDTKQLALRENNYIFKESEGLPLLVVELVKAIRENTDMEHVKGGLGALILARFGEIPETHREFMRVLSVFTNGAEVGTMEEVLETERFSVVKIVEELLKRQLIKETETVDSRIVLDFVHSKVRECVYDTIPVFKKKEYNKKIAQSLGKRYSPHTWDPAMGSIICYHYTLANMPEQVVLQHLREMRFHVILNHDLFPLIEDDILLSCKMPFSDNADTDKKMDEINSLLKVIRRSSLSEDEILSLEGYYLELRGGHLISRCDYKNGYMLINRALQIAKEKNFNKTYIYCLQHIGHNYLQTDKGDLLLSCSREMLRTAKKANMMIFVGLALRFIGVAFQIKGDFIKSERALRRSAEVFEEQSLINGKYTISVLAAKCYIGENYHWQGNYDKAMEYFEGCIKECEDKGLFWGCSHFHGHMANVAFDTGDAELMNTHIYKGAELFEKCQGGISGSVLYSLKAIADARQGMYSDAMRSIKASEIISMAMTKCSWTSVHIMAMAYLAGMKEEGRLPQDFDSLLTKSAREYANEAAVMCKRLGNVNRYNNLRIKFEL